MNLEEVETSQFSKIRVETTKDILDGCYSSFIDLNEDITRTVMRLDFTTDKTCVYLNLQSEFGLVCKK